MRLIRCPKCDRETTTVKLLDVLIHWCPSCDKRAENLSPDDKAKLGKTVDCPLCQAAGCDACCNTGKMVWIICDRCNGYGRTVEWIVCDRCDADGRNWCNCDCECNNGIHLTPCADPIFAEITSKQDLVRYWVL